MDFICNRVDFFFFYHFLPSFTFLAGATSESGLFKDGHELLFRDNLSFLTS